MKAFALGGIASLFFSYATGSPLKGVAVTVGVVCILLALL